MEIAGSDEEPLGYFWFYPLSDRAADMHVVFDPEHRGRWASRSLVRQMDTIAHDTLGYDCIVAQTTTPQLQRACRAVGFKVIGPIGYKLLGD